MKLTMVGYLDQHDIEELRGMPVVVLTGTFDEVREAGPMLYEQVTLTRVTTASEKPDEHAPESSSDLQSAPPKDDA